MITVLIIALTACSVIALVWNYLDSKKPVQNTDISTIEHTEKEAA